MVDIKSTNKYDAFEEMLKVIADRQPHFEPKEALRILMEREQKGSTDIMRGIAVPHGICESVSGVVGVFGFSSSGIAYNATDGTPIHVVYLLLANPGSRGKLLQVMSKLALLNESSNFVAEMASQKTADAAYEKLKGVFYVDI
jgi:mannitol/fructose-specific phosphotransferase system IIA component (Ntr-type)